MDSLVESDYQVLKEACSESPLVTSSQGGKALSSLDVFIRFNSFSNFELIISHSSVKNQSSVHFLLNINISSSADSDTMEKRHFKNLFI